MADTRTILGIDPGTNVLGFGVIRVEGRNKPRYVDMGVVDLRKVEDHYERLSVISERIGSVCDIYKPDDLAIESPFYGKNVQVIFKLGRAQGAAISAARTRGARVYEYAPRKAKVAVCGNGGASKEQVSLMVQKTLGVTLDPKFLDATDALALALCHYYQLASPLTGTDASTSWKKFIESNPGRVSKQ